MNHKKKNKKKLASFTCSWVCLLYLRVVPPHFIQHFEEVQLSLVTVGQSLQDLVKPESNQTQVRPAALQSLHVHSEHKKQLN